MPKLTKKLPSYRKHKASGQAVVTLGGIDHYLGPFGTAASKREYDRLVGEHLTGSGVSVASDALTMVELLAGFYKHAQQHYGPRAGETRNFKTLIRRLRQSYGDTPASAFGPLRLKAFRQKLIDEKMSRNFINQTTNRVRRIFKWGVENELVRPDVLEALKAVAGIRFGKSEAKETEPIRPVADAFVDATLEFCPPQVAAMIQLQRLTGMRPGEVCIMRTCDISTAGDVWTYKPSKHKTQHRGHERIVYIGPKAQGVLRPWLRTDLESYLFPPSEAGEWHRQRRSAARKTPLSCGNRPGTNQKRKPRRRPTDCYTANTYRNAIIYAVKRANKARAEGEDVEIPNWHPNQLRHNHATLVRREHGLEVARVILGHKHAAVTEIYAEADQRRAIQVMGEIG